MKNLIVKLTSQRSGAIGWLRPDGTPSDYRSEAGHFSIGEALDEIASYVATLRRVVGRCRWTFEILERAERA